MNHLLVIAPFCEEDLPTARHLLNSFIDQTKEQNESSGTADESEKTKFGRDDTIKDNKANAILACVDKNFKYVKGVATQKPQWQGLENFDTEEALKKAHALSRMQGSGHSQRQKLVQLVDHLNSLADDLPYAGFTLDVYLLSLNFTQESFMPLLGGILRLREWHGAAIFLVSKAMQQPEKMMKMLISAAEVTTVDPSHLLPVHLPVWRGVIAWPCKKDRNKSFVEAGVSLECEDGTRMSQKIDVLHYWKPPPKPKKKKRGVVRKDIKTTVVFGRRLEVLACVEITSVPMYLFDDFEVQIHVKRTSRFKMLVKTLKPSECLLLRLALFEDLFLPLAATHGLSTTAWKEGISSSADGRPPQNPEKEWLPRREHLFVLVTNRQEVTDHLTATVLHSPSEINPMVFEDLHIASYFGFLHKKQGIKRKKNAPLSKKASQQDAKATAVAEGSENKGKAQAQDKGSKVNKAGDMKQQTAMAQTAASRTGTQACEEGMEEGGKGEGVVERVRRAVESLPLLTADAFLAVDKAVTETTTEYINQQKEKLSEKGETFKLDKDDLAACVNEGQQMFLSMGRKQKPRDQAQTKPLTPHDFVAYPDLEGPSSEWPEKRAMAESETQAKVLKRYQSSESNSLMSSPLAPDESSLDAKDITRWFRADGSAIMDNLTPVRPVVRNQRLSSHEDRNLQWPASKDVLYHGIHYEHDKKSEREERFYQKFRDKIMLEECHHVCADKPHIPALRFRGNSRKSHMDVSCGGSKLTPITRRLSTSALLTATPSAKRLHDPRWLERNSSSARASSEFQKIRLRRSSEQLALSRGQARREGSLGNESSRQGEWEGTVFSGRSRDSDGATASTLQLRKGLFPGEESRQRSQTSSSGGQGLTSSSRSASLTGRGQGLASSSRSSSMTRLSQGEAESVFAFPRLQKRGSQASLAGSGTGGEASVVRQRTSSGSVVASQERRASSESDRRAGSAARPVAPSATVTSSESQFQWRTSKEGVSTSDAGAASSGGNRFRWRRSNESNDSLAWDHSAVGRERASASPALSAGERWQQDVSMDSVESEAFMTGHSLHSAMDVSSQHSLPHQQPFNCSPTASQHQLATADGYRRRSSRESVDSEFSLSMSQSLSQSQLFMDDARSNQSYEVGRPPLKETVSLGSSQERQVPSSRPHSQGLSSKERRSQRHKRRLEKIVSEVLIDNGISPSTSLYTPCFNQLYHITKYFVKQLPDSYNLTEDMRNIATKQVDQIVDLERRRQSKPKAMRGRRETPSL